MPQVLVVHPAVKAASLKELIALAKARPGELNYSSSGSGSSSHLAIELLKFITGINLVHVPFKGSGQSMPALLAGQVQMIFDPLPTSLPHVKSGKLRALAISTLKRSPAMPDLPTAAEAGVPGFDSSLWYGLLLPADAPLALVERLNKATNDALAAPDLRERFAALGADAVGGTAANFGQFIAEEIGKWGKVIKAAGIKGE
jgi:tripartite-type tricarboxylate transporter receptor subunit TctC